MTADPIRDALREAVRDMNGWMADRGYEVPWSEDCRLIAAAAVAGFLRAYAANVDRRCVAGEWFPRFAAAVERAATEGA